MSEIIKEQIQVLVNKFADSSIKSDDVYVRFDTDKPDFFNELSIIKDVVDTKLFRINTGVYRKFDNMGYMHTYQCMDKKELVQYLMSGQGLERIQNSLKELLNRVVYMD